MITCIRVIIATIITSLLWNSISLAQNFSDDFPYKDATSPNAQANEVKDLVEVGVIDEKWPIQQLIKLFLPDNPSGTGTFTLTTYIQYILNLALSIVAFIATIVLIVGFYGILFGKSEDGIANAQKTVKWAVIALLIMWASWLIVTLLFYIIAQLK